MNLEYAEIYKNKIDNLAKLQEILAPHQLVLDSDYLLLMEQAEDGDMGSILTLAEHFLYGTASFKPNYDLCARYAYKAFDIITQQEDNTIALLEAYNNLILIEAEFGHLEKSKQLMREALEVAMEDFDYQSVYGFIHQGFVRIVENSEYEEEENDSK